jgi:alcohol dehydrogenase
VESTGKRVTSFKPGDAVFAYGAMSPTKLRFGAYAEYMCLPEDWNLALKPANVTFEEAAAIPYGASLAWYFVKEADMQPQQKVLIYGASGSNGTMAIQFAKNAGAVVTVVCSGKNHEMVQSLGADKVIDYTCDDAVSQLEEYDLAFDAVGESKTSALKTASKSALTPQGKYISVDNGTPSTGREDFLILAELVEQGKLKPVIDRYFPLEEMIQAHKYVEQGHRVGNVVITVVQN